MSPVQPELPASCPRRFTPGHVARIRHEDVPSAAASEKCLLLANELGWTEWLSGEQVGLQGSCLWEAHIHSLGRAFERVAATELQGAVSAFARTGECRRYVCTHTYWTWAYRIT